MRNFLKNISEVGFKPASLFLCLFILASCNSENNTEISSADKKKQELIDKGRVVYFGSCVACHNQNPKFDGSIGPAIQGSSLELVRLRVLFNKYPEGYTPKRTTTDMPPFEDLKDDIESLHAFLNQ